MTEPLRGETDRTTDERVFLGISDLYVRVGEHIGHFYQTREEGKAVLTAFLKAGLEMSEKCVYLTSPERLGEDLREALAAAQIKVEEALASEQLILDTGRATPEELRAWLTTAMTALPQRFRRLRWGGDMTWVLLRMPTSEQRIRWSTLWNFTRGFSTVFLCQYDLTQLPGSAVIAALQAHPLCIVGNIMHRSPLYAEPGVYRPPTL